MLIIRSKNYKFGAYLSHPLTISRSWTGSPACFLFSLTVDLKFPYHGRVPPLNSGGPLAFYADREALIFGNDDLRVNADLRYGSSRLEGCYGLGLAAKSLEASCILAGDENFEISQIEIWGLFT